MKDLIILNYNFINFVKKYNFDLKLYKILPIDSIAVSYCIKYKLNFLFLEELNDRFLEDLYKSLIDINKQWIKNNDENKLDITGEFDAEFMWILWQRLMISLRIDRYLVECGFKNIFYFSDKKLNFDNNYYEECDNHIDLLTQNKNYKCINIFSNEKVYTNNNFIYNKKYDEKRFDLKNIFYFRIKFIKNYINDILKQNNETKLLIKRIGASVKGKIVYIINYWDLFRVANHLKDLNKHLNHNFCLIIICKNNEISKKDLELDYEYIVIEEINVHRIKNFKKDIISKLNSLESKDITEIMKFDMKVFNQISHVHWNKFYIYKKFWTKLFKLFQPKCLFSTNASSWEIKIASNVAHQIGIDTYLDSHGIGNMRPLNIKAKYYLTNYKFDEEIYSKEGINKTSFIRINNLSKEDEYETDESRTFFGSKKFNSLFLTTDTGSYNCLNFGTSRKYLIESLETISNVPSEIFNHYSYGLKVHPGYPDLDIFKFNNKLLEKILSPNINIQEATKNIDLVISLNYAGLGLLNYIKREIPVVLFWIDNNLKYNISTPFCDIFFESGKLITCKKEFWPYIIGLTKKDFSYRELLKKVKNYNLKYIKDFNTYNFSDFSLSLKSKYFSKQFHY